LAAAAAGSPRSHGRARRAASPHGRATAPLAWSASPAAAPAAAAGSTRRAASRSAPRRSRCCATPRRRAEPAAGATGARASAAERRGRPAGAAPPRRQPCRHGERRRGGAASTRTRRCACREAAGGQGRARSAPRPSWPGCATRSASCAFLPRGRTTEGVCRGGGQRWSRQETRAGGQGGAKGRGGDRWRP